jgi:hypothetical protein
MPQVIDRTFARRVREAVANESIRKSSGNVWEVFTPAAATGGNTFSGDQIFLTGASGGDPVVMRQTGGGAGTDEFQIYHASGSYLVNKTGELRISSPGNIRVYSTGGASFIVRNAGDGANLFSVDGTGVAYVTTGLGINGTPSGDLLYMADGRMHIRRDSGNEYIRMVRGGVRTWTLFIDNSTGALYWSTDGVGATYEVRASVSQTSADIFRCVDNGNNPVFEIGANGAAKFYKTAYSPETALTDAVTVNWDVLATPAAKVTFAGNRTIAAATNSLARYTLSDVYRTVREAVRQRGIRLMSSRLVPLRSLIVRRRRLIRSLSGLTALICTILAACRRLNQLWWRLAMRRPPSPPALAKPLFACPTNSN